MSATIDPWAAFRAAPDAGDPWAKFRAPAAEAPPQQPPPPAEPIGFGGRVLQGVGDLPAGFSQLLANTIPEGAKPTTNAAAEVARYLPGMVIAGRLFGRVQGAAEANEAATERERVYQDRLKASGVDGADWGRMLGQALTSLPAAAIPGGATWLGAAGIGAGTGAALGGLQPVPDAGDDYARRAVVNALAGGVGGAAGGVAGKAIGGMIAPRIEPNVRALADAGVELTPGQIVGGAAKRIEDAATSIPIVGQGVANAQRRSLESFNRAVGNEVLAPIGKTVAEGTPAGRALVNQVDDAISDAYRAAHAKVAPFKLDQQFLRDFYQLTQSNILMPDQRDFFRQFMARQFIPRVQKGDITGEVAQEISSELKRYARTYAASADVPSRELAASFRGLVDIFDDLIARTNPAAATDIKQANAAFARLIRMEAAAGGIGAKEGVFTAPQFAAAVRQNTPRKAEYALGGALMQELSDPASVVLPSSVPDSGTAARAAWHGAGAGAGATAAGLLDPALMAAYLGTTAAGRVAYSEPATRAFRAAALANRPEIARLLAEGVRRGGQMSGGTEGAQDFGRALLGVRRGER